MFVCFNAQWSQTLKKCDMTSGDRFCHYIFSHEVVFKYQDSDFLLYAASESGKVKLDTQTYMSAKWLYCTVHMKH